MQKGQHIIDPRIGYPVQRHSAAWAIAPQAAISDALSTAFMVMSIEEIERFCSEHKEVGGLIISRDSNHTLKVFGDWPATNL